MDNSEIQKWMKLALELAQKAAAVDEVPIGAVLVHENSALGTGYNQRESLNLTAAHAEMVALEQFNRKHSQWRLPPNTSIFVTAEPCIMCVGALLSARIENIYFGCHDPKSAGILSILNLITSGVFDHQPSHISGGLLKEESGQLLSNFFQKKRSKSLSEGKTPQEHCSVVQH